MVKVSNEELILLLKQCKWVLECLLEQVGHEDDEQTKANMDDLLMRIEL